MADGAVTTQFKEESGHLSPKVTTRPQVSGGGGHREVRQQRPLRVLLCCGVVYYGPLGRIWPAV